MKIASLLNELEFNEKAPAIKVMIDTEAGKEIRMAFRKGQSLKEHKTPYPIVVEIFEGQIDFGVNGETQILQKGNLIALDGNVPHDLMAKEDSIVRLSLNKADSAKRVEDLTK